MTATNAKRLRKRALATKQSHVSVMPRYELLAVARNDGATRPELTFGVL